MWITNKNQAPKKFFGIFVLSFLALFLFSAPVLASLDCSYTTSTGVIECDDSYLVNLNTYSSWFVILLSFVIVLLLFLVFGSLR